TRFSRDWSSDVCSSDLSAWLLPVSPQDHAPYRPAGHRRGAHRPLRLLPQALSGQPVDASSVAGTADGAPAGLSRKIKWMPLERRKIPPYGLVFSRVVRRSGAEDRPAIDVRSARRPGSGLRHRPAAPATGRSDSAPAPRG